MTAFLTDSLFFGAAITIVFYILGLAIKKRFRLAVLNPTLIAVICVIAVLFTTDTDYAVYKQSADVISWFLTPATICLALPLYEKLHLLKKHWKAVCAGLLSGVFTSLVCIWLMCWLMKLSPELYATFLPKSITTAIGLGVSEELGGVPALTVACIILTGIFGSITCEGVFKLVRIHSPIAKGVAIGASAHAIGTAKAMELGQVEGAMSSLALAVCGLITVPLAPLFHALL